VRPLDIPTDALIEFLLHSNRGSDVDVKFYLDIAFNTISISDGLFNRCRFSDLCLICDNFAIFREFAESVSANHNCYSMDSDEESTNNEMYVGHLIFMISLRF
jgi:hypothetical protein